MMFQSLEKGDLLFLVVTVTRRVTDYKLQHRQCTHVSILVSSEGLNALFSLHNDRPSVTRGCLYWGPLSLFLNSTCSGTSC